jgi:hypothetical protein
MSTKRVSGSSYDLGKHIIVSVRKLMGEEGADGAPTTPDVTFAEIGGCALRSYALHLTAS